MSNTNIISSLVLIFNIKHVNRLKCLSGGQSFPLEEAMMMRKIFSRITSKGFVLVF